jgi:ketosteroid isomerase-like protein
MPSNSEILSALYDSFAKGDIPSVLQAFDPQIEWTDAEGFPTAGTFRGPDAIVQNVFMPLGSEWDGFSVSPEQLIEQDDNVVAVGTYTGKFKATGKSMKARFAHVWQIKDGKAIRFEQIVDSHMVQQALQ